MVSTRPKFVVACPHRSVLDDYARLFEPLGALRFLALGTRRGTKGVSPAATRLNPLIGLVSYGFTRFLPRFAGESLRFGLFPWFDAWVRPQLQPGDHLISSFAMANRSFRQTRARGGKTFLDAGNSHPENFWSIIQEEHRQWNWHQPPFSKACYRRCLENLEDTDYIFSPSAYVSNSFLSRGFRPDQILRTIYPVDLSVFTPSRTPRPADRPLTIISTGALTLRKGTPYLLEAFRLVRREEPAARLLLTRVIMDSAEPILRKYADLPIEWAPPLPHPQLAERLRSADLYVLPTLEEGLVRTAAEALACGLPSIVTSHSGINDFITPGVHGSIVPIRDARAVADAILEWWAKIRQQQEPPRPLISPADFSFEAFANLVLPQLRELGLLNSS